MNASSAPALPTVVVTVTVNQFPAGGGGITDFKVSVDLTNAPAWLGWDFQQTIKAAAKITPPGPVNDLLLPKPGSKVVFQFVVPTFVVNDVPKLASSALQQNATDMGNDGSYFVTFVATGKKVKTGLSRVKYSLTLGRIGSHATWIIDPDFETDVTIGNV